VRSLRSRSPLTRIYTQQQSSDIFMAYGEPIACSSYRTIGTVGGDNQFSPSKHERKRSMLLYIFFPVYDESNFRRLLAQSFVDGSSLDLLFNFFSLSFIAPSPLLLFLFHLSLIERRDHFSSHASIESSGETLLCFQRGTRFGNAMFRVRRRNERILTLICSVVTQSSIMFCKSVLYRCKYI